MDYRKLGFGSSDAKWIRNYGLTGHLSHAAMMRIGAMKGQCIKADVKVAQMLLGLAIEDEIYQLLKQVDPDAECNPIKYGKTYGNFSTYNHIDYIYRKNIWIEIKATIDDLEKAEKDYQDQLAWHRMILAQNGGGKLMLMHYSTEDILLNEDGSPVHGIEPERKTEKFIDGLYYDRIIEGIVKGLEMLDENWDSLNYTQMVEWELSTEEMMEVEAYMSLTRLKNMRSIINAAWDEAKGNFYETMKANGMRSIKWPKTTITMKKASMRKGSYDMEKLQNEHPEINIEDYRKPATVIKESISIK